MMKRSDGATLKDVVHWYRPHLDEESVGVRRSWEEMFTYTFRHFAPYTPLNNFDVDELSARLSSSGMHAPIVEGYATRWRMLLSRYAQ